MYSTSASSAPRSPTATIASTASAPMITLLIRAQTRRIWRTNKHKCSDRWCRWQCRKHWCVWRWCRFWPRNCSGCCRSVSQLVSDLFEEVWMRTSSLKSPWRCAFPLYESPCLAALAVHASRSGIPCWFWGGRYMRLWDCPFGCCGCCGFATRCRWARWRVWLLSSVSSTLRCLW